MATFYTVLVFIHIFSAIIGLGPGFILIQVVKSATTLTELKHAYAIRKRLHIFVMIGGTLLLITGLLMGLIHTGLFRMGWYVVSLILFFMALAIGPLVLAPQSKPLKAMLHSYEGDDIPKEYQRLANRLFMYERMESVLFLIIIALMILKPF